ncbi:MAG: redox-regulated ATPase YchF [Limnochordia bacterium]|nr:redox-regulated ATPase YchF [Limnochordia bacterium]MDI9464651.1 redox-regulated ATPase YchF [Bacillota bacterium]NLO95005.1 redox-regulated ATPase YchF [Bacillota bacterium]HAN95262.1 redox-regulated ATPase YchF [Bacillota bacterium]HOB40928.1 redox-regulated ATPase YchF [Limnochordia bacterium]
MKIGIIGKPQAGKSVLFRLLTKHGAAASGKAQLAVGRIPDPRVDALAELYKPRKVTYATIDFWDVPGFQPGRSSLDFLQSVRDVDALVAVLRAFESDLVPSITGIQPYTDFKDLQQELLIADWTLLETRLERLAKQRGKNPKAGEELAVLEKCRETLEQDLPLRSLKLNAEEEKLVRSYDFFTKKPLIAAVNLDEGQMAAGSYPQEEELEAELARMDVPLIKVSAQIEAEISELEAEDARLFLAELGLAESGIARIARTVYAHLGLISFFTAGEKEVHSWTIRRGDTACRAAGKIHSDLERGFIRAEVVAYEDLLRCGSMQKAKEQGLFRLEGKEYIVQDGDVITFRFNV